MSYDFETEDRSPPELSHAPPPDPTDLEVIVTLLELGAIYLTDKPGQVFTLDSLLSKIREIFGEEFKIDERDILIVLDNSSFLKKLPGKKFYLK